MLAFLSGEASFDEQRTTGDDEQRPHPVRHYSEEMNNAFLMSVQLCESPQSPDDSGKS